MWILAGLAAAAAYLGRRLRLRDPQGRLTNRAMRIVAPVLLVAALAVALAQTIVIAVLAEFSTELGTDAVGATWLLTSFMLASAVATPIAGRLGDQHGYRRLILVGLALLVLGSALTAFSTDGGWYPGALAGRVIQGLAGGIFPCAFGFARQLLPTPRLGAAVASLSAMFGVGGAIGMVAAGPLSDVAGLESLSWFVAALSVLALAGILLLPAPGETVEEGRSPRARRSPDAAGGLLLAATLVMLLLAISQGRTWGWASAPVAALGVGAAVTACLFLVVEHRVREPLIDLRLLIGRRLLALNLATVVVSVGMFAAVTLLPLFAQTPATTGYGFGFTPARTGLLIAPIGVFMIIAAPLTPRFAARIGARGVFQAGAALAGIGLLGLGLLHQDPIPVAVSGAALGLAYGLAFGSLGSLIIGASPPEQTGAATGVNTVLRTVGGATGSAIAVAIVAGAGADPPTEAGYTSAFTISALIALSAAVIAAATPNSRRGADENTARTDLPEASGT